MNNEIYQLKQSQDKVEEDIFDLKRNYDKKHDAVDAVYHEGFNYAEKQNERIVYMIRDLDLSDEARNKLSFIAGEFMDNLIKSRNSRHRSLDEEYENINKAKRIKRDELEQQLALASKKLND